MIYLFLMIRSLCIHLQWLSLIIKIIIRVIIIINNIIYRIILVNIIIITTTFAYNTINILVIPKIINSWHSAKSPYPSV